MPNGCSGHRTPTLKWRSITFTARSPGLRPLIRATEDSRQEHVEALADHHRQLAIWAEHCPENFENRAALVGAEIARIEGRVLDAEHSMKRPSAPRTRMVLCTTKR